MRLSLIASLIICFLLPLSSYAARGVYFSDNLSNDYTDHKRLALVVGNSKYEFAPLKNPTNDAKDIAQTLENLGFEVIFKIDATFKEMKMSIRNFGERLSQNRGVGLFYYAGHGMQISGENYLIPVGADIKYEDEVEFEAIDAKRILNKMESARNPLNIVFLDACRNNPLVRSFRSASKGLMGMQSPKGSVISYATASGSVASDGSGKNGIYTKNLLNHIQQPGLELAQLMKRVREGVQNDTNGQQVPFESSSLTGDFYFIKKIEVNDSVITTQPQSYNAEEEVWGILKESPSKKGIEKYLEEYPNGRFRVAAEIKLASLFSGISKNRDPNELVELNRTDEFVVYDNGTIKDLETNKLWQLQSYRKQISYYETENYCDQLDLGGRTDWQFPGNLTLLEHLRKLKKSKLDISVNLNKDDFLWSRSGGGSVSGTKTSFAKIRKYPEIDFTKTLELYIGPFLSLKWRNSKELHRVICYSQMSKFE